MKVNTQKGTTIKSKVLEFIKELIVIYIDIKSFSLEINIISLEKRFSLLLRHFLDSRKIFSCL